MREVNICDVRIHNISFQETLNILAEFIHQKRPISVVTPNVDHIIKFQNDQEFRQVYQNATLVLPDGMPLLWAAQFLGTPLKEKISGSDLFPRLCELAAQKGWRLFFLGGREGVAVKAADVLRDRYTGLMVVGCYCPPFGFENNPIENEKIIRLIRDSKPDIVFVGLGAPKQEKWIDKYKDTYGAPVSIGIGISFEFIAGMVKRAPVWMQKIGLEWFWRLLMEPGRLWKRYLIDDMQFFWLVLNQKIGWREGPLS